ncbi:MAG: GNAT family N-acetyltransferase [Dehalococcoidia bacterium]|nr:GNAT family N-acetyltransferase [Dehalococcoidia bacterium]
MLKTEYLFLRDFLDTDWTMVHEYASDVEVVRYQEWGPNTEAETKDFVRRAIASGRESPRRNHELAIVLSQTGLPVGGCGIYVSNPSNREGYIGYCINRTYWGQGYATEAARALLEFGFVHLGLHRIFATCDPANTASARVLEKAGMLREGHLREHKWAKGRWRDSFLYGILETDKR